MNSLDQAVQALQSQVTELQRRVQELELENEDLCKVCMANGVQYEEFLRAQRHRRYFKQLCSEHPTGETVMASDAISVLPIIRSVAEFSGSVVGIAMSSRSVFATAVEVTASLPWSLSVSKVLAKGYFYVFSLAVLQGLSLIHS